MSHRHLRQAGLKVTVPRVKILEVLENAEPHHMSAEHVYRKLIAMGQEVGLATVYRVLTQFEEAALIKRHNFESGHAVYEINHGNHHDHLVCVQCGHVEEFLDELIERRQALISQEKQFEMLDHKVTIYGRCIRCQ